ncbi:hypothetical protein [Cryobacterium sp. Y11]|nr:hypothetical protein [Cryobacterium sp. Y11]
MESVIGNLITAPVLDQVISLLTFTTIFIWWPIHFAISTILDHVRA